MILFVFILLVFFILSLLIFLTGIILAVFELSNVLPSVICTCIGLAGLFGSAGIWLTAPICPNRISNKHEPKFVTIKFPGITKYKSKHQIPEQVQLITPDTTENLMKSIRGIPFLIQAIQYSLETTYYSNLLSEMGQIGNSVIHTAPGCTSVLDCDSDEEHNFMTANLTPSPRCSGPEEQWEAVETNRWSNSQLRLSMNRRTSSLLVSVFPYSESRPVDDTLFDSKISSRQNSTTASERGSINDGIQEHPSVLGSQQSQISRVAVSYTSLPSREIRCIGMSPAVLNRFNSSFRATAAQKDV